MDIRLPKTTAASEVPSGGETIRLNRGFHVVGMYLSPSRHGNSWTPRLAENTSVYRKEGYHYDLWRFKNVHFITKANKFDHVNNINCPNMHDTLAYSGTKSPFNELAPRHPVIPSRRETSPGEAARAYSRGASFMNDPLTDERACASRGDPSLRLWMTVGGDTSTLNHVLA